MWSKKASCMIATFLILCGMIRVPVDAVENNSFTLKTIPECSVAPYATGTLNISIPAKYVLEASTGFTLEAGETVTIKASYSPFSASLNVGLVAPNGKFYGYSVSNGTIDKTIQVDERGTYTLRICNNSNYEVQVSGYVNY